MDIVVLAGGLSPERDVSFVSGSKIAEALRSKGHRVILLDVFMGYGKEGEGIADAFSRSEAFSVKVNGIPSAAPDLAAVKASREDQSDSFFGPNVIALCRMAAIVFLGLHGKCGEDGRIQAAFDLYGIRYTGSNYLSSAICMDKSTTKVFLREGGVPVPEGITIRKGDDAEALIRSKLRPPYVVKPLCGGSSIGVSIVRDITELPAALTEAFRWEDEMVVEEYIEGREFSICVLEGKALPIIEIAPISGFYDYKNKYQAGSTVETCPAKLPLKKTEEMQSLAVAAAKALGLDTYSRMDFLMKEDGSIYCLEANTLPGMTPTSLIPQEAAVIGIDFPELCEKLIEISLRN